MRRVAVAVSGGRDSTALLHCTLRAAAELSVEVHALHVHHGLSPHADAWGRQVQRQAKRWGAGFAMQRLSTQPAPGNSIEAWARRERYRALAEMAHAVGCDLVLLAHHRRDQAETWLLQALRGAGAAGLSSMPASAQRAGLVWARPWLAQPREAIETYVRRHRIKHIEDDSNADPRHARNRLRLQVWPVLTQAFADAEVALCAAATQAQQASALADEVAAIDLPAVTRSGALVVPAWLALPNARRRNALRAWLARQLGRGSPNALLDRLTNELPVNRSARWAAPDVELRLYRGLLSAAPADELPQTEAPAVLLDLSRPGRFELPAWQGGFAVTAAEHGGIAAESLRGVTAAARAGGERFRLAPRAAARSLRKQFQALAVPAWARTGPLLFNAEGRLLFVPGLGIEASARAAPGAPQLSIAWVPAATGRRQPAV